MEQKTIIIVDDDPPVREIMSEIIMSLGYHCLEATNGLEALEVINNNEFDIIITDIHMPGLNGLDLMTKVREITPESPFIVITGYYEDYSYDKIIQTGASDYIKKPFTIAEFEKKITRILVERRLDEENKKLQKQQADTNAMLSTLIDVATDLSSELNLDRLFPLIIGKVTDIMAAERTSLYIIDRKEQELWTKVAEGVDQIRLPIGKGISGKVALTGEVINVANAWDLPYFDREFDKKNNFRTRSVLCMPICNNLGAIIGILQVINKENIQEFNKNDELLMKGLTSQIGIALENSLLHEELKCSFDASIRTLSAAVDAKHRLTGGHSERVTQYSLLIAQEMGLDEEDIETLKFSALLHDIGKIAVPDNVLLKNGPFSPEDRIEMNNHPVKTKEILSTFHFPQALEKVPEIASYHHEKINGKGYPYGLTGDQLPLGSKIMAVADVFDALTSPRDYPKYTKEETLGHQPMPITKAVSILKSDSGSHFDPDVVNAFIQILPEALAFYRGTHFPPEYVDNILYSSTA